MQDVEVLRVCEISCRKQFQGRFELRISSSEILDAIFEECLVELADRVPVMQLLYYLQNNPGKSFNSNVDEFEVFKKRFNTTKLLSLVKIKGSFDQV